MGSPDEIPKLYIVTPVFNDRPSLGRLLDDLAPLHDGNRHLHVVVVEDGSPQDPVKLADLQGRPFEIELITLRRNLGHQRAIATGLAHVAVNGAPDQVLIMDGDGEDRPQDIPCLLDELQNDRCDLVVAQRRKREESVTFKVFYRLYRALYAILTGSELRFGNFCAMTPRALWRLVQMEEVWMHLPAAVIVSRLPLRHVYIDRGRRYFGNSKMNLVSLITHGLRSIAVSVESVLTRIILFCAAVAGTSILLILVALTIKVFGYATPGWFTAAVGALLVLLVQTATIALVSVLLAINTRNAATLIPVKVAFDYIERVEKTTCGS